MVYADRLRTTERNSPLLVTGISPNCHLTILDWLLLDESKNFADHSRFDQIGQLVAVPCD